RLALDAHDHLVLRELEVLHVDFLLVAPGGDQGGLVDQVGQVGAGETGSAAGDHHQVDALVEGDVARMDLEDAQAAVDVRPVDDHAPVEAAGAQQGRIEHVRPVG